jgi:hypothetical protein
MADDDNGVPLVIDIQLAPDATPLDFLTAVYRHSDVPLSMRIDAAKNAAMYKHPRLVAIAAVAPGGEHITVRGGLPALPGATTIMPGEGPVIEGSVVEAKQPKPKPEKPKPTRKTPADEPVDQ